MAKDDRTPTAGGTTSTPVTKSARADIDAGEFQAFQQTR